jgi:hypothetical protein
MAGGNQGFRRHSPERVNSPQRQRKAPQTARGFNSKPRHPCGAHPSAKADIA